MIRALLHSGFVLDAFAWAAMDVCAEGVYRTIDESGCVVYTDRPPATKGAATKLPKPASPSRYEYEAARTRADSERVSWERSEWENHQRRPIVIHDPQGLQTPQAPVRPVPGV